MSSKITSVIGPSGRLITLADLPAPGTSRWNARKKALVLFAVCGELITFEKAEKDYTLTHKELQEWARLYGKGKIEGLKMENYQACRK